MKVLLTHPGASCQQAVHTFFPGSTGLTWHSMQSSSVGTAHAAHFVAVDPLPDGGKRLPTVNES